MSSSIQSSQSFLSSQSPLLEVAKRYEQEQNQPSSFMAHLMHYHDKNPDFALQLKLLQKSAQYISQTLTSPEEIALAELGILLILRDLLFDPNTENKIYSYLIEEIDLDLHINRVLKRILPTLEFNLTDPKVLEMGKKAINLGQNIVNSAAIKADFPPAFVQDINDTILAETDETNKMLKTIEVSRSSN